MLKQLLVFAVVIGMTSAPQEKDYKEYGSYDLQNALKFKTVDGTEVHSVDLKFVGQVIDDLAVHADHPRGNYHYGVFLAGTVTKQKESLPYLEKAIKSGKIKVVKTGQ